MANSATNIAQTTMETQKSSNPNEWFAEDEILWPGQRFALKIKEEIYRAKSKYQDIRVFDSETYGRVLVLDGAIQITERDEFAYQEMITHLPMFAHANPTRVLIVGGGDGGVLREVCRHDSVIHVCMCEIDEQVVQTAKTYFSQSTATSFNDSRVELRFMDAAEYVKQRQNYFDVIIVDSSDPVGPAETLYQKTFYRDMYAALREGGIICTQGECLWLHLDLIREVMKDANTIFQCVDYGFTTIPTYPSGQIGFIMARKGPVKGLVSPGTIMRTPSRPIPNKLASQLRYYSSEIHKAAFILPEFAARALATARAPNMSLAPVGKCSLVKKLGGAVFLGIITGYLLAKNRSSKK